MANPGGYLELSVPVGGLLIFLGGLTWLVHSYLAVFSDWAWAVLAGSLWILLGASLLFSDVRLYQFDRSPVEQLLTDSEES